MKEIAARGDIEEEALFQYVIDGLDDQSMNKSVLYGARNVKDFKEKLKIYEKLKTKNANVNKSSNPTSKKITKPKEEIRCFNCGDLGHKSTMCDNKSKGAKCFRCNEFGHKSIDCKKEKPKKTKTDIQEDTSKTELVHSLNAPKGMYKIIEIRGEKFNALVDTGSQFNIVNQSLHNKIGAPILSDSTLRFSGFGGTKVIPIGCFEDIISINDDHFKVTIYVVADDVMKMKAVIGSELLSQAEVNITQDSITIKKLPEINDILSPSYAVHLDAPDIGHTASKERGKEVQNLLDNYKPKKIQESNIKMTITLNKDKKIIARPRRLPFLERKIVDEQVKQWIEEGIVEPCSSEYASPVVVTKKRTELHEFV